MRVLQACLIFSLLAVPVLAAETPWQEVAPGVKLRLIGSGEITPDGTTLVGLEIDMPATTKTYWRVPGDTGLPTELDFGHSAGVTDHTIWWPYPTRDQTEDYLDYVYFGPTVLPVELAVSPGATELDMSAVLGICSDICIPAQATFSMPLFDHKPDRANGLRLRQAVAMAPIAWTDANEPFGPFTFDMASNRLLVPLLDPTVDPASLIAATPSGEPLFGAPALVQPGLVGIPVDRNSAPIELANRPVQLTFMTDMGSFEVTRSIQPAGAQ